MNYASSHSQAHAHAHAHYVSTQGCDGTDLFTHGTVNHGVLETSLGRAHPMSDVFVHKELSNGQV